MDEAKGVPRPLLVIADALAGCALRGVETAGLSDWRAAFDAGRAFVDPTVIGLALSTAEASAIAADPALDALLRAADIPVRDLGPEPTADTLRDAALDLLAARAGTLVRAAAEERAALAELRRTHMQMQTDHAELEAWVWDALAPKHKLMRAWPATARTVALGNDPVRQPLPLPIRGFAAVDIHLAESAPEGGHIALGVERPGGPAEPGLAAEIPVPAGASSWLRLNLPHAGTGPARDGVLSLAYIHPEAATLPLSLAPESPFADLNARADTALPSPLALRLYRTLPHMPAPSPGDPRFGLPADGLTHLVTPSQLGAPELLPYFAGKVRRGLRAYPDAPETAYWEKENAVLVQPSTARPVVARLPGLTAQAATQLRAIIQISRHDTLPVAFALGAAPKGTVTTAEAALQHLGDWVHLQPGEWGEAWRDLPEPLAGDIDLLLATAMPDMPFNRNAAALFHGFRVTTRRPG